MTQRYEIHFFGMNRGGVGTQQRVRSSLWKDLGKSCDAARGEKQFLQGFDEKLSRSTGEKQVLEGVGLEL